MTITKILVKRFETAGKNLPTENLTFRQKKEYNFKLYSFAHYLTYKE